MAPTETEEFSRREMLLASGGITAATLLRGSQAAAAKDSPVGEHTLSYRQPATRPIDALPVGNGRQGAIVMGGVRDERIILNDDCFWAGRPEKAVTVEGQSLLAEIRTALFAGNNARAEALCRKLQGRFTHSYAPLADLRIVMTFEGEAAEYRRTLELDQAVATVEFSARGSRYRREMIASYVDKLMFCRISRVAGEELFSITLGLETQMRGFTVAMNAAVSLLAKAPVRAYPNYYESIIAPTTDPVAYSDVTGEGMFGAVIVQVIASNGEVATVGDTVTVRDASDILIAISTATGFREFDVAPDLSADAVMALAHRPLNALGEKGWNAIRASHIADHQALYRRVSLTIGHTPPSAEPTDQRLEGALDDPALAVLLFNLGRYLLIASSRPGSQAANLQGIWSWDVRPPWSANYTTNINVQENYWPAEACGMPELAQPYFDLVRKIAINGARTAREIYGLGGWCCHHNTDIWCLTSPVGEQKGDPKWANFALAGPWLVRQLWERWLYGGDRAFLRYHAYPLMRDCAQFCSGWLVAMPGSDQLVTAPSVSTENSFIGPDGKRHEVTVSCTMDIAMIREVLTTSADAADILKIDSSLAKDWRSRASRLPHYQVGRYGQLQEWLEDYGEAEPDQRHLSHLYMIYPGDELTPWLDPDLLIAAEVSLDRRLAAKGGPIGWSEGWKVNLFARMHRPEKSIDQIRRFLTSSANTNLLSIMNKGSAAIFQIDGNFAMTAGIAEMLLQSHGGCISLLPALPSRWSEGNATGLCARGGLTIDMTWIGGRLNKVHVRVARPGTFCFQTFTGQRVAAARGPRGIIRHQILGQFRGFRIEEIGSYEIIFE